MNVTKTIYLLAAMVGFTIGTCAQAQEFTPPGGKGRVIVAVSGSMGAKAYEGPARKLASFGYDVILLDGNSMVGDHGVGLKAAIDKAPQSPNALPGKVGVVGFSLGGGQVLGYAPQWSDQVAVVVVMYPLTSVYKDIPATVGRIKVPVLMFAGEKDTAEGIPRLAPVPVVNENRTGGASIFPAVSATAPSVTA